MLGVRISGVTLLAYYKCGVCMYVFLEAFTLGMRCLRVYHGTIARNAVSIIIYFSRHSH
jgi:hypothetical protein